MANINSQDLKFYESERITDFEDGGGRITGKEVVSAVVNNVFEDKSRVDTTLGNVSLRKVYVSVDTANTEPLLGAHAIITSPPVDPLVHVTMFSRRDYDDERVEAADYLESYVTRSIISRWRLLQDQIEGQRVINVYGDIAAEVPAIGAVLFLSYEPAGVDTDGQYVRVIDVRVNEVRTFVEASGAGAVEFDRRVLALEIGSDLTRRYPGGEPTRFADPAPTKVRETVPVASAKYYGIAPFVEARTAGELNVKVDAIFKPVVPSAQQETALIDQPAINISAGLVASATSPIIQKVPINSASATNTVYTMRPLLPGAIQILEYAPGGTLRNTYTDGADGVVVQQTTGEPGGNLDGSVLNYFGGSLALVVGTDTVESIDIVYQPAVNVNPRLHSAALAITIENIAYNYTAQLLPLPAPGTTTVSYMAEGRWYTVRDNGRGELTGDGSGSVNFVTGSAVVTLLRQPDPDSAIIWQWGGSIHYERRSGAFTPTFEVAYQLPGDPTDTDPPPPIRPGSCSWTWTSNSATKNATESDGVISGDATGFIYYGEGRWVLYMDEGPDPGTTIQFDYDAGLTGTIQTETPTGGEAARQLTFTLPNAPIEPGTVDFSWSLVSSENRTRTFRGSDDGQGAIRINGEINGTVNYTNGNVVITVRPA